MLFNLQEILKTESLLTFFPFFKFVGTFPGYSQNFLKSSKWLRAAFQNNSVQI
jgi:hypothetical protein